MRSAGYAPEFKFPAQFVGRVVGVITRRRRLCRSEDGYMMCVVLAGALLKLPALQNAVRCNAGLGKS